jgi:hypothetical protein
MERYGYFGGDVTGGYVLLIPTLNWRTYSMNRGLLEEWFTRLDKNAPDSYIGPALEYVGRDVPYIVERYEPYEGCVNNRYPGPHTRSVPVYRTHSAEARNGCDGSGRANIKSLLHCWGTKPIVETIRLKVYF